jgi:hypothetical protein
MSPPDDDDDIDDIGGWKPIVRELFGVEADEARAAFMAEEADEALLADDDLLAKEEAAPPLVLQRGVEKKLTTLAGLKERYALLETNGSASVYVSRADFLPITDIDLARRLSNEVVYIAANEGKAVYEPAFKFWTGHARRHIYKHVTFTSQAVEQDVYNLYKGLGVTPREGPCKLILAHVHEVLCSGIAADSTAMLDLMAWQIQNVGQPSRIIVVLKSEGHQPGKGIILGETLLKIYGPSGFAPAGPDQVLGRFNGAIRGRAFVFLDEVVFSGDRKAADALKRLSTTTICGIETKGLPTVTCPVGVNVRMNSNHANAAFVEERDERFWAPKVSEHRIGDHAYFADLWREIENGGREAFAHHLLTRDVLSFVPWRDVPKANGVKREMIKLSINPYDARKWLEDCCLAERIIGKLDDDQWFDGREIYYFALRNAYVEWQKTVKTKVAPEPTPVNRLGELLTDAGFGSKRRDDGRDENSARAGNLPRKAI